MLKILGKNKKKLKKIKKYWKKNKKKWEKKSYGETPWNSENSLFWKLRQLYPNFFLCVFNKLKQIVEVSYFEEKSLN